MRVATAGIAAGAGQQICLAQAGFRMLAAEGPGMFAFLNKFFKKEEEALPGLDLSGKSGPKVLSLVPAEHLQAMDNVPKEAIAGYVDTKVAVGANPKPDQVRPNPAFVRLLHKVIQSAAPQDPTYRQEAARQQKGWVYIVDMRVPRAPKALPEDILGAFEVVDGVIVEDSYKPNGKHQVFSNNGLTRLSPFILAAFIRELKSL